MLLYLFVVGNWGNIGLKKGLDRRLKETEAFMHTDEETKREIEKTDLHMAGLSRYTEEIGGGVSALPRHGDKVLQMWGRNVSRYAKGHRGGRALYFSGIFYCRTGENVEQYS